LCRATRSSAISQDEEAVPIKGLDLLVAEIDAKAGGYGIVPDDLAGAVVSSHTICTRSTGTLRYSLSGELAEDACSAGAVAAVHSGSIELRSHTPISLPNAQDSAASLDEQRRILGVIDKVEQARKWHSQISEELEMLQASVLDRAFSGNL
jgi:type I restriction enzyme S subunit